MRWHLEFASDGVAARIELVVPDSGPIRYEFVASGESVGPGFVVVRAEDIPRPRHGRLELRADGLWAEMIEEAGDDHWSLGLEAFGLRVDDPADEIGDRIPVGYDLEWERPATAPSPPQAEPPARVHGEVLIGQETIGIRGATARLELG